MANSELTLRRAIECVDVFCPVKILYNSIVLYNDYDGNIEIEEGIIGESGTPIDVIPERIWQFDHYIVTSINVEIVEFHHAVVTMSGEYRGDE